MKHRVIRDTQAGELEKILSGIKTMLVKEFNPAQTPAHPVNPGDSLYFLRDKDDCALRVQATVVRVQSVKSSADEGLAQTLKEMQSKLQLTEDQFNHWSQRPQILLVEFDSAHKIDAIPVTQVTDKSDWITFKAFSPVAE